MKVGHPLDPNTEVGPLAHQEHFDKVMRYMTIAQQDGATTKVGDIHRADLGNGCYVSPTLFTDADTSMHIAQEEIFGPVLTTIGFDTEEEAISIANDTDYGCRVIFGLKTQAVQCVWLSMLNQVCFGLIQKTIVTYLHRLVA